jgi:hypothetical protein
MPFLSLFVLHEVASMKVIRSENAQDRFSIGVKILCLGKSNQKSFHTAII